jgi:cold shock CspA family protein
MHQGTVKTIVFQRGYGFIAVPNQPDIFFHCHDLDDGLAFDEQLIERRVRFDIEASGKGPRAVRIRPAF